MIDDQKAIDSLNKVNKKGEDTGGKLGKIAGAGLKAGAAIGAGAIAGGAALLGLAGSAAGTADRIDKLAAKSGLSKTAFQEWDYVMGQNGMSIEKMQTGMKTLVQQMDGVQNGSKKSIEMFDALGISVQNSDGSLRSQEEVMEQTIMALARMPEGAEKARLATELFGKSGVEMAPMLATGEDGIKGLIDRSHELGLVMSDEAVGAGVVFGDTMDDVKDSLGMVATNVGIAVMPAIQTFLDWILSNMPTIQTVFSTVMGAVSWAVTTVVDAFNLYLMPIITAVFGFIQSNWPLIQSTFQTVFGIIQEVIAALVLAFQENLLPIFTLVYDWVQANWPVIKETIKGVFDTIKGVVETAIFVFTEVLLPAFRGVYDWVQANWPTIRNTIENVFRKIKEVWDTVLKPALDDLMSFIRDTLVPKIQEWFPKIQQAVESAFSAIKTIWDTVLKPVLEAVWGFIEDVLYPAFSTVFDGIKIAVETAFDAVGVAIDVVTGIFEGIKTTIDNVSKWFNDLRDGITNAINAARDAVDLAIQKIKGFFDFDFKWPELKMPSFSITGSMNPLNWLRDGVPKLSVNWNAEGGIFDKPTIFGTARGLQGVGEAGPEAIMPLSKLQTMLDWNSDKVLLQEMVNLLKDIKSKNNVIALDGDKLVGGVYDRIDEMVAFKQRENELAYGG